MLSQNTLSFSGLESALEIFIKTKKHKDYNDIFNDTLVLEDNKINIERLREIADSPVYQVAYLIIKNNTSPSLGRKGETISSLTNELINPFIKYPFNKYLLPLLVFTSGNNVSCVNYWSMKIKIDINIEKIAKITQTEVYKTLHFPNP